MQLPAAGAPRSTGNPALAGLRTWPVKGFDCRVYDLMGPERLTVVRILHDKRDVAAIIAEQQVDEP